MGMLTLYVSPSVHRLTQRSFFLSPDGTQWWNVYHATTNSEGSCDGNRYTSVQIVNWNSNGTPNFGVPVKTGTTLSGPSGEK